MQIAYTLTKQDYERFYSRAMKQAFTLRPLLALILFLPGLMLSLSIGYLFITSPFGHGDWNRTFLIAGGIMIACSGFMFGIFRFIGPRAYLKRPGALAARVLSVHPEGMLSDVQGMITRLP